MQKGLKEGERSLLLSLLASFPFSLSLSLSLSDHLFWAEHRRPGAGSVTSNSRARDKGV